MTRIAALLPLAVALSMPLQAQTTVEAVSADGVTVYGETYFGSLDDRAPLVLLFHQGGSNGMGEYADLAPYLNAAGFRAIAWDLRSGGDVHGGENRTVRDLPPQAPREFCDARHDLQAALDYVVDAQLADRMAVWGSSFSAALVFRLAAENPQAVSSVMAFSPASGGPLVECRAREWIEGVTSPVMVFRPDSEMARESSLEQREILTRAGAEFVVVENGVHGASMLLDSRTESDMSAARDAALAWLRESTAIHPRHPTS